MSEIHENEDSGSKENIIVIIGQLEQQTTSEWDTNVMIQLNEKQTTYLV